MRAAPPVAVSGSGGRAWQAVQTLLWACTAAVAAAWTLATLEHPSWPGLLAGLLAAGVAWPLVAPRPCELRWDGEHWSLGGTPGRLAVALDLGPFLLIRLRPDGARRHAWWAVTAAEAGAAWPALRAALYSRPPETTPRGRPPERAAD